MANRDARLARANRQRQPVAVIGGKSISAAMNELDRGLDAAFNEPERRRAMIAEAAYYRAEQRGFECGHEVEDWCAAEAEIDTALTLGKAKKDTP